MTIAQTPRDAVNEGAVGWSDSNAGLGTVTPEMRAIEHAEYMAKSAEHFIQANQKVNFSLTHSGAELRRLT